MLRRPGNLLAIVVLTLIAGLALSAGENDVPANALFALPLVLFVPGYAISLALFRKNTLTVAQLVLFSLGLSLAVVALGGLVLNYTPWGLQFNTWLFWSVGVSLIASAIAFLRGHEPLTVFSRGSFRRPPLRDLILLGFAGVSVLVALGLSRIPAPPEGNLGYTALWVVPDQTRRPTSVDLGLLSSEFTATTYDLQLKMNSEVIQEWKDITLQPGARWTGVAHLPPATGDEKVEAFLYRASNPNQIYRYALIQSQ